MTADALAENAPPTARLEQQLAFALEIDRLKEVWRQTWLIDGSRRENGAEHSWELAVMALLLGEHAGESSLDLLRVVQMLLIHDLVEIDAGDTFVYDQAAERDRLQRERAAAERLFGMLPADQARQFRELWDEFEAGASAEARFAAALDRLQPILHNFHTRGKSWREHGVTARMVLDRNGPALQAAPQLWEFVRGLLAEAVRRGYLTE